jgi:hypothetical protein
MPMCRHATIQHQQCAATRGSLPNRLRIARLTPPDLQRVDALEAVQLAQRQPADPGPEELDAITRLHRLCVFYDDAALKARPSARPPLAPSSPR